MMCGSRLADWRHCYFFFNITGAAFILVHLHKLLASCVYCRNNRQ